MGALNTAFNTPFSATRALAPPASTSRASGLGGKGGTTSPSPSPFGASSRFGHTGEQDGQTGGPVPGAGVPSKPRGAPPSPIDTSLADFEGLLGQYQPRFFGAEFGQLDPRFTQAQLGGLGEISQGLSGIGGELQGIYSGQDPRFDAFRTGQNALLNQQRQATLDTARGELARTGVRGTAATNELNRLNQQFDVRQMGLSGDIGLQELGRGDTALAQLAGLAPQQAALLGQGLQTGLAGVGSGNEALQSGLGATSIGLQNAAVPPTLRIAQEAATRAGGGGKK